MPLVCVKVNRVRAYLKQQPVNLFTDFLDV